MFELAYNVCLWCMLVVYMYVCCKCFFLCVFVVCVLHTLENEGATDMLLGADLKKN